MYVKQKLLERAKDTGNYGDDDIYQKITCKL